MSQHYPWLKLIELTGGFPRVIGKERKTVFSDVDVVDWLDSANMRKETIMSANHAIQTGNPVILSNDYGVEDCDTDRAKDLSQTPFWICAVWDGDLFHVVMKGTGDNRYIPMPGTHNLRSGRENRLILDMKEIGL